MPTTTTDLSQLAINTIRTLSMDAVEAPTAAIPARRWPWRRSPTSCGPRCCATIPARPTGRTAIGIVLSCGHASMLLYSLLHLAGVKQSSRTARSPTNRPCRSTHLRNFRQLDSRLPGHPEYGHTTGVETTTGPLGQGCGNSVGMAIASKWLAAHVQPARLRAVRLQRLRPVQRRRPDGRASPARPPRSPGT